MFLRLGSFLLACLLLLGCAVQPAPSAIDDPSPDAIPTDSPAASAVAGEPTAVVDEPTQWTVGLVDEPSNVLPFSPDGRAAAPIVEALFPAPALGLSYAYTTTGILETLPTPDNGDVQIEELSGFLDASGEFTTTETTQPTTTQQLSVTYRWNPELTWADGTPVTAADSVWSYELFGQVQAPQEAQVTRALLQRYEQVDEYTTRAVFKPGRIDPNYLQTAWPPLPQHQVADLEPEEALAQIKREPLGYGPYTFAEQRSGVELVLSRNPFWPGGEQLPDQLVFRFYASPNALRNAVVNGEVDVGALERVPQELFPFLDQDGQSGAANVTYLPGPVYEHLDLNLADGRLQDARVRRALAYAINRQGIADGLFGGKTAPLESWILPGQADFYAGDEQLTRYPYDPNAARALLDEAGYADGNGDGVRELPDGTPFTLTLLTTDTQLRKDIASRIAADLQAVGVQIEPEAQPIDQLYSPTGPLYRRTFQLALFAWIAGVDPGGLPLWSCNAVPIQENGYTGNNFSGWCYEAAEWPLREANNTLDRRTRAREYLKHQQLWTQEVPSIPLVQRPLAIMTSPAIDGVQPDPIAPITWNIDQWRRK